MHQKLVSILLTLSLCFGLFPMGVYAEENKSISFTAENAPNKEKEENKEEIAPTDEDNKEEVTPSDEDKMQEEDSPTDEDNKEEVTPSDEDKTKEKITPTDEDKTKEEITPTDEDKTQEEITPSDEDKTKEEITPSDENKTKEEITPTDEDKTTTPKEDKNVALVYDVPNSVSVTIDGETKEYYVIDQAFTAAQGKTATITMLSDSTALASSYSIQKDTNITFEGGNYTLNCSAEVILLGSTFTLKSGTINANFTVKENGNIIIEDGTTLGNDSNTLSIENGTAEIKGGTISKLVINSNSVENVTLSGGTFKNGITIDGGTEEQLKSLLASGYEYHTADGKLFTDFSGGTIDEEIRVVEKCDHMCNLEGTCVRCGMELNTIAVTIYGETTEYTNVKEAFAAAQGKTATIRLLQHIDARGAEAFSVDITSDITFEGGEYILLCGDSIKFNIKNGGTFILKSGFILEFSDTEVISVYENGKVALEGGNIISPYYSLLIDGGTADIKNGSVEFITLESGALNISGGEIGRIDATGGTVTISGGDLYGVSFADPENVEISGGTFYYEIKITGGTGCIADLCKAGYTFYIKRDGNVLSLEYLQNSSIDIGFQYPLTVQECKHTLDYDDLTPTDNGDGTHSTFCKICNLHKTELHVNSEGRCIFCGIEFAASVKVGNNDEKYFAELEQAWAEAKKQASTVTVLKSLTGKEITVEDGDDIALEMSDSVSLADSEIIVNGGALTLLGNMAVPNITVNGGTTTMLGHRIHIENMIINAGTVDISTGVGGCIDNLEVKNGNISISGSVLHCISTENDEQKREVCDLLAEGFAYRKAVEGGTYFERAEWLTPEEYHTTLLDRTYYMVDKIPFKITEQSEDIEVSPGEEISPLTITTDVSREEYVAYQWYSVDQNGGATAIENATQSSYTPQDLAPGIYQYYCEAYTSEYYIEYFDELPFLVCSDVITITVADKETLNLTLSASPSSLAGGGIVTLTLAGLPAGQTADVTCQDTSIAVLSDKDSTFTATLPDSPKTYTFTANYAGNDIYHSASASCQVTVSESGTELPPSDEDDETLKIVTENGIATVPEGLKNIETLNTPQKLETKMKTLITETGIKEENTAVYNVTLMVSTDGGKTWIPATEQNFPANGKLTITLPYPEGTDSTYEFVVVHMFTTNAFDKIPGTTEKPEVENTKNGIRFCVTGLSPISVGWTVSNKPDNPNEPDNPSKPDNPSEPDNPNKPDSSNTSQRRGGKTGSLKKYDIIIENSLGGKIIPSRTTASKGSSVTLNIQADTGYTLEKITVTDALGETIALDNKNMFAMPNSDVNVKASFITSIQTTEAMKPTESVEVIEAECPSAAFADLQQNAWYHQAVDFVLKNGLMYGYSDKEFAPNDTISRAQLAQILYQNEGRPAINTNSIFTDVPENAWYATAVNWAASKGIVNGYGNGIFAPNDTITREQFAVMLWQYAQNPDNNAKELSFHDGQQVSSYALHAIYWAVENGILHGYEDNTLRPKGFVTRAQAAQMLKTFIDCLPPY